MKYAAVAVVLGILVAPSRIAGAQTTQTDCHRYGNDVSCTSRDVPPPCGTLCALGGLFQAFAQDQANNERAAAEAARVSEEEYRATTEAAAARERDAASFRLYSGRLRQFTSRIEDSLNIRFFPSLRRDYENAIVQPSLDLWRVDHLASNRMIEDQLLPIALPYADRAAAFIARFNEVLAPYVNNTHYPRARRMRLVDDAWVAYFAEDGTIDPDDSRASIQRKVSPLLSAFSRKR